MRHIAATRIRFAQSQPNIRRAVSEMQYWGVSRPPSAQMYELIAYVVSFRTLRVKFRANRSFPDNLEEHRRHCTRLWHRLIITAPQHASVHTSTNVPFQKHLHRTSWAITGKLDGSIALQDTRDNSRFWWPWCLKGNIGSIARHPRQNFRRIIHHRSNRRNYSQPADLPVNPRKQSTI